MLKAEFPVQRANLCKEQSKLAHSLRDLPREAPLSKIDMDRASGPVATAGASEAAK
jgi:hypothetical protein